MKVTKNLSLRLTEEDLKEAVVKYLEWKGNRELSNHLHNNCCMFDWVDKDLCVVIDGELEDS